MNVLKLSLRIDALKSSRFSVKSHSSGGLLRHQGLMIQTEEISETLLLSMDTADRPRRL
jgi:hypothetical protein